MSVTLHYGIGDLISHVWGWFFSFKVCQLLWCLWFSLTIHPYQQMHLISPLDCTQCSHSTVECKCLQVRTTGCCLLVHHCFFSSDDFNYPFLFISLVLPLYYVKLLCYVDSLFDPLYRYQSTQVVCL